MNVWIALRGAPNALIQARLRHGQGQEDPPPYNGPVAERHANLFQSFHDWENVQGLFKKKGQGNGGYTLWSVHVALGFDEDGNPDTSVIDDLQDTYPGNQVLVLGAWDNEGLPFGMQWELVEVDLPGPPIYDDDGNVIGEGPSPGTTMERTGVVLGTPTYSDEAKLLDYIPDVVTYDENGVETSRTDATVPTNVNLLAGQAPRVFVRDDGSMWT